MSTPNDEPAAERLATTWEVDLDYLTLARFAQLVVKRGFEHTSRISWATERMTLEGLFDHALFTSRDATERAAVLDLSAPLGEECIAHLSLEFDRAYLLGAARSVDALSVLKSWLQDRYPPSRPDEMQQVQITFWTLDRQPRRSSRTIAVPTWNDIARNYPSAVRDRLTVLAGRRFDAEYTGKLVLWHGLPGTGKTYALRALAWEWRSWCSFHYITDPEAFFAHNPAYMLDVLLDDDDDEDDASQWRLLILEDTGELLAVDAKHQTGQGLSRLLNVVDGLIGQGLHVIVLVTTNEDLRRLHPAVSRPGRCIAKIEFKAFTADEADEWLEGRGEHGRGSARTLAELFGGEEEVDQSKLPVGFSVR